MKRVLGRIERHVALKERVAEIEPRLRRFVGRHEVGIVGNSVLGPIERQPAVLRIGEALVLRQDGVLRRGRKPGQHVLVEEFVEIGQRGDDLVGEVASGRLLGIELFGGILRADVVCLFERSMKG